MKTHAWGWLVAGAVALGLNGLYRDGGLSGLHRVADEVEHRSAAVLALATGQVDQYLAEARLLETRPETASPRVSAAIAQVQAQVARSQSGLAGLEDMTAQEEGAWARVEANRARMEACRARIEAQRAKIEAGVAAHVRVPADLLVPVSVKVPVVCPRVRVVVPRMPRVPMIPVSPSDAGPI